MKRTVLKACLLGGALGDSIGLPSEGINARRIARLRPGALRQSLVFGKGMVSDDTEHAVMTLLSLMDHDRDVRGSLFSPTGSEDYCRHINPPPQCNFSESLL